MLSYILCEQQSACQRRVYGRRFLLNSIQTTKKQQSVLTLNLAFLTECGGYISLSSDVAKKLITTMNLTSKQII